MRRSAPWSEDETLEFRRLVQVMPLPDLARQLKRSRGAIITKAAEEGLQIRIGPAVIRRSSRPKGRGPA